LSIAVLSLAGLGTLISCGGGSSKSITRAEAVTALNKIETTVTADGFKKPTKLKKTRSNADGKTSYYVGNVSVDDSYFHVEITSDFTIGSGDTAVSLTKGSNSYAYKDGTNYVFYTEVAGGEKGFCKTDSVLVKNSVEALCAGLTATYIGTAGSIAKYLGNFNDDGSAITGGTARDATLAKYAYTSTGDGNVTADITAHYSYDERMVYAWDNNLVKTIENDLHDSRSEYAWGSADVSAKPDLTAEGLQTISAADAVIAIAAVSVIFSF
jgi:hypothetical protein